MSSAKAITYRDLREYIEAVDRLGELSVVNGADEVRAGDQFESREANRPDDPAQRFG